MIAQRRARGLPSKSMGGTDGRVSHIVFCMQVDAGRGQRGVPEGVADMAQVDLIGQT